MILLSADPRAQLGIQSAAPRSPGSQGSLLPLSGRPPETGTVTLTSPAASGLDGASPSLQVQGTFSGSIGGPNQLLPAMLSLRDAVQRGLEFNLGLISVRNAERQSRGQRMVSRSALLPSVTADLTSTVQQLNLAAMGFRFSAIEGFSIPSVVGPFSYMDLRARVSQTVFDLTTLNNYRASTESARASALSAEDTRDLVVLAVGGAYLQALAARARVDSARAQLETANVLYQQNMERRAVGLVAQVDVDRSQVQALTQQQRVTSLQNDFAKQKIKLTRMIGLPPRQEYELSDRVGFTEAPNLTLEQSLAQARQSRADLEAAAAQVRAAERALAAVRAERMPSVAVNADYGTIGATLTELRPSYSVVGVVRVPIWQGGRVEGHIDQAETTLAQRRAELEDLTGDVESELRQIYLDLEAADSQVKVAEQSLKVSREVLALTRQRFEAGITDNVEVVQAQESVAAAELDYINSVSSHNLSKLNLARAIGQAAERLSDFVTTP
jgi:outer membrane protein TolC